VYSRCVNASAHANTNKGRIERRFRKKNRDKQKQSGSVFISKKSKIYISPLSAVAWQHAPRQRRRVGKLYSTNKVKIKAQLLECELYSMRDIHTETNNRN